MPTNRRSAPEGATTSTTSARNASPGKVRHDTRGNAVWDWNIDAEELDTATTTGLIRALSGSEMLSLVAATGEEPGWCGDPYNRRIA